LETGESTDHQDTSTKTLGQQVLGTDLAGDLTEALALVGGLAHLRHQRIGRMRHDGAHDTGNVARGERDTELRRLAVAALGLGEDVVVEHLHNLLKEEELGHGVRDLTRPERLERTEREAGLGSLLAHHRRGGEQTRGPRSGRRGLHLDLDHLHGAERHIGEQLGRCRTGQPDHALVLAGVLLASHVRVRVLEELVQTELEQTLHRVADQRRRPTERQTARSFLGQDGLDAGHQTTVLLGEHLHLALGDIERNHGRVRQTAAQRSAEHALGIVRRGVRNVVLITRRCVRTRIPRLRRHGMCLYVCVLQWGWEGRRRQTQNKPMPYTQVGQ
jgi:hypothetical protein